MPRDHSVSWVQKTFARTFHQDGDRAAAAKAAGSQAKDLYQAGTVLLANPKVKRLLAEHDVKSDAACIRNRSELEEEVHSLMDEGIGLARKGRPIIGRDGKIARGVKSTKYPKGEPLYQPDVPALLKGAELKGKTIAMFVDKQRIEGEFESKSDQELSAMLLGMLAANHMLLEAICREDIVQRKVRELDRQSAASDEGGEGVQPETVEPLSPSSEASEISPRRLN